MQIDIYDFDKTVYPTDSETVFWLFCVPRNPWILIYFPVQLILLALWGVKIISTKTFKGLFMRFLVLIDTQKNVKAFWDKNEKKIYPWFLPENRERYTVVISASPDFLLKEICTRLKVDKLICTIASEKNGKITGENCKGEEKIKRFNLEVKNAKVICVYSDDIKSDTPIFRLGEKKIHTVDGERIILEEKDEAKV